MLVQAHRPEGALPDLMAVVPRSLEQEEVAGFGWRLPPEGPSDQTALGSLLICLLLAVPVSAF